MNTYWEAVDCTLKFCDSTILKRIAKQEIKVKGQGDAPTFECKEFNEKMPSADSRNDYQDHWKDIEDVVAVSTDFTGSIISTANHQILQGVITGGAISTDYFITFELLHYLFNIGWKIVLKIL